MPYFTEDNDGKLNNFAVEPKMYKAEPQSASDQKGMMALGIIGGILVLGLIGVTFLISGAA